MIAENIKWEEESCKCTCSRSGQEIDCNDRCSDLDEDIAKCIKTATTTLTMPCSHLDYETICPTSQCSDETSKYWPYGPDCGSLNFDSDANDLPKTCVPIQPEADAGPEPDVGSANIYDDQGGCSISPEMANLSVLFILFFVAGLSLLISRKKQS